MFLPAAFSGIAFLLFNLIQVNTGGPGQFEGMTGAVHNRLIDHLAVNRHNTATLRFGPFYCANYLTRRFYLLYRGHIDTVDYPHLPRIDDRLSVVAHVFDKLDLFSKAFIVGYIGEHSIN